MSRNDTDKRIIFNHNLRVYPKRNLIVCGLVENINLDEKMDRHFRWSDSLEALSFFASQKSMTKALVLPEIRHLGFKQLGFLKSRITSPDKDKDLLFLSNAIDLEEEKDSLNDFVITKEKLEIEIIQRIEAKKKNAKNSKMILSYMNGGDIPLGEKIEFRNDILGPALNCGRFSDLDKMLCDYEEGNLIFSGSQFRYFYLEDLKRKYGHDPELERILRLVSRSKCISTHIKKELLAYLNSKAILTLTNEG